MNHLLLVLSFILAENNHVEGGKGWQRIFEERLEILEIFFVSIDMDSEKTRLDKVELDLRFLFEEYRFSEMEIVGKIIRFDGMLDASLYFFAFFTPLVLEE